jgi:hypothetical protein
MIRTGTVAIGVLAIGLAASARAQQQAAPPVAPWQVELTPPSVPVQMLAPDARRLIERLGTAPAAVTPAPRASGGGSRTITLPHTPVENPTPEFLFQDVTDRTEKVAVEIPPEQRRAAVEAFRQSLVKRKGARR